MTGHGTGAGALIARLAAIGVEVRAEGDRLLCHGPRRLITREIRAELAARKREILEHLARSELPARDAPLSYAQQRLWFLDQMQPGSAAYTLSMAQHLRGALDAQALRRALSELVRRHEILRCTFPTVDGAPVQRVAAPFEVDLPVVDLRHLPLDTRDAEARRLARAESRRPFALASDRLLRAGVYVLGDESHLFLLAAHHMVADGWSVALIGRELGTFYGAAAAGRALPAGTPAAQYSAYAGWQREALAGDALERDLRYWQAELARAPWVLELPTDRPRPPVPSCRGGRVEFQVDSALAAALRDAARAAGASLFMLLLAAAGVLLGRHARQAAILIGTPIAGRNRAEWTSIVGCFVNTLALRVDLAGDPSFVELLGRVRDTALDAFDHQDLPFERVVEALQPERDLSRNPLVQVSVGLHNAPGQAPLAALPLPGLDQAPVDLDPGTVRFDLELDVWEVSGGLHARLLYARDLFDASTAERLVSQLGVLLAGIAADPGRRVSRLPIMTPDQRVETLARWNPAEPVAPRGAPLHALVAAQAERTPDAVAVVCGETRLSYAELMTQVRAAADAIARAGVRPGDPVGLCAGRGPAAVVGMLGILETGAAYVPIDPDHPPARVERVLEDSGARVIVTESQLGARFSRDGLHVVPIVADGAAGDSQAAGRPRRAVPAEALAYVMYTSGSTGRPKGVAVPHRAVVGLLDAIHRVLPLGPGDVFLAVTTFAFDISVLEIFLPLVHGASLVIAEREETVDGVRLAATIARRGVTAMQATPATWGMLVESGWSGTAELAALCGGEALPPTLAAALLARCARVWNVYGPTETTIWSSVDEVRDRAPVTIGYPLDNSSLHVLDEHLEPQPRGMIGEIWIGGSGVSRGYFRRPDLTAERFVPDPFAAEEGARMYRSGDLGRRLDDGRIEWLGRLDAQVKFRGFRIEPGDVEAALVAHDSVAKAVVVLRGNHDAERRLCAYVVAHRGRVPGVAELRRHLHETLPGYLVPGDIVVLDALPMTPNAKIDRAALPDPSRAAPRTLPAAAPANDVERTLAEIWAAVLRTDVVDVDDSFFDLGGHSLLLTRVRAEIASRLGRDVAVLDLFRWPTVRALARHLGGADAAPAVDDTSERAVRQIAALGRIAASAGRGRVRNG